MQTEDDDRKSNSWDQKFDWIFISKNIFGRKTFLVEKHFWSKNKEERTGITSHVMPPGKKTLKQRKKKMYSVQFDWKYVKKLL